MPTRPEVLHGAETLDDAGIIAIDERRCLVQTIDFFPPTVDDPRDFGRIAAANALSDVYAMGGEVFSVLNVVGFPRKELDMSVLGEILAGGAEKIAEAGGALLGGHSVEDNEVKYGLSVTGLVDRDQILTNDGARPGDVLVLTKPLGMGAVTTSVQQGIEDPDHVRAAVESMAALNRGAATALRAVGADSATDITGFGLLGHGCEMAKGSKVSMRFHSDKLPFTPGAEDLARRKVLSGGAARGRSFLKDDVIVEGVAEHLADLAFDAETSGGLLIAISEDKVDTLVAALRAEKTSCAVVVGEVTEKQADGPWVQLL